MLIFTFQYYPLNRERYMERGFVLQFEGFGKQQCLASAPAVAEASRSRPPDGNSSQQWRRMPHAGGWTENPRPDGVTFEGWNITLHHDTCRRCNRVFVHVKFISFHYWEIQELRHWVCLLDDTSICCCRDDGWRILLRHGQTAATANCGA